MPVANTQPVYSPASGAPIQSAWGQGVAEAVIQRFTTTNERDAEWTSPPEGARCQVAYGSTGFLDFLFQGGAWYAKGLVLCANLQGQSLPVDDAYVTLQYSAPSHNVANGFAGNVWTAPVNGYAKVTSSCIVMVGSTAGGWDLMADYNFTMVATLRSTPLTMGQFYGRFSAASCGGSTIQYVSAGDQLMMQVYFSGGAGKYKTIQGAAGDVRQLIVEYV